MTKTQRTRTDFLCLTISAGAGTEYTGSPAGVCNKYTVSVQSDATDATIRFDYYGSINNHDRGVNQLDRQGLLFALWSFVNDGEAGSLSFADFCDEFGENIDSISAKRTWQACKAARAKFDRLFHDHREPSFVLEQLALVGIE